MQYKVTRTRSSPRAQTNSPSVANDNDNLAASVVSVHYLVSTCCLQIVFGAGRERASSTEVPYAEPAVYG